MSLQPTPPPAPERTRAVVTTRALERTLRRLGVREGGVLVVHASLSALGYVVHGAEAARQALEQALGPAGTLLVPTFTGDLTDPSCWTDPALPAALWSEVRDSMPAFDPARTLPRQMGRLALSVCADPARRRSLHPLCSWAAVGPHADRLTADHDLRDPFGARSPVGRALELGAQVLLLGVDQRANSALMHAHCLADAAQVRRCRGPFLARVEGRRQWVTLERLPECTEGYAALEDELVARGLVRVARAGDGTCRLMDLRDLVPFVEHALRVRPELALCGRPDCRPCAS